MPTDPRALVVDTLTRLHAALVAGDVEAALDCFVPDGALFGEGVGEDVHGHDELAATFTRLVDRGLVPEWEVDDCHVRRERDGLSFVADAVVLVAVLGRRSRRRRFRMSGTLRADGPAHRLELFNGLDPIIGAGLHTVG